MLAAKRLAVLFVLFSDRAEGLRRMSRKEGAHGSSGNTCGMKGKPPNTTSSEASMLQSGDSIIGGDRVGECEWPWLVGLRRNALFEWHCSAVLISPKLILAVKECILSDRTHTTEAIAGNRNLKLSSPQQQRRAVDSHKWHTRPDTEIAILELEEPFEVTDCVRPICLPSSGADVAPGTSCMMAGLGSANDWLPSDLVLFWQHAEVTTVSADECESSRMTSQRVCARGIGQARRHQDQGDPCSARTRVSGRSSVSHRRRSVMPILVKKISTPGSASLRSQVGSKRSWHADHDAQRANADCLGLRRPVDAHHCSSNAHVRSARIRPQG